MKSRVWAVWPKSRVWGVRFSPVLAPVRPARTRQGSGEFSTSVPPGRTAQCPEQCGLSTRVGRPVGLSMHERGRADKPPPRRVGAVKRPSRPPHAPRPCASRKAFRRTFEPTCSIDRSSGKESFLLLSCIRSAAAAWTPAWTRCPPARRRGALSPLCCTARPRPEPFPPWSLGGRPAAGATPFQVGQQAP